MITADVLEFGQQARHVLRIKHGDICAVFNDTIYLRGDDSLCCLGLNTLVSGPINVRTSLVKLSDLRIGDHWHYHDNTLTLGQYCQCSTLSASQWNRPEKPALTNLTGIEDCIEEIEAALVTKCTSDQNKPGVAQSLMQQRLNMCQSLFSRSLQSQRHTDAYVIPPELLGLLGCGDGLTPAGDDILLGVLVTTIHFDQPRVFEPLTHWLRLNAADRTNQISYAHLMSATLGFAIEPVHTMLNRITDRINNPHTVTDITSAPTLQQCIHTVLDHGYSSGYYTLRGVQLALNYLSGLKSEQR